MEVIGSILLLFGLVVVCIGGFWFLVVAFQESVLWGVGCFLFSPVALIFLILHWDKAGQPFLVELAGFLPILLGMMMVGPNA